MRSLVSVLCRCVVILLLAPFYPLKPKRDSVLGTVLGCLNIGILNNGLVLLEISPFWQQVTKGLVIPLAVSLARISAREDGQLVGGRLRLLLGSRYAR